MLTSPLYRYEKLAGFVSALIDEGTFLPGTRVPSVRQISKQQKVSLTTALQAYRLLEDRGILEARPQSGFYVATGATVSLETPRITTPPAKPISVTVSDIVLDLLEHAADPRFVPLGRAIPSASLLAAGRLDRFLARAARAKGADYNVYTVPRGDARLRQEIARRALHWGQGLAPEDIAITCGCTEALTLALKAVTRPGDTVAIESPTYFGLLQVIEALNLKALELPTDSTVGIDLAALDKVLKGQTVQACLLSSSFNNPLGCTMPEEKKLAVLKLLTKHNVPLIEDDIFGDIYFGKDRPKPFIALDPDCDVIYCSSFSKTVAPGYRVGWIATSRHMRKVLEYKIATTFCGPALPQAAMADFLSTGGFDGHLRRIRRALAGNVDRMTRTIDKTFPEGTRISRPAGGFVLWLELPERGDCRLLFSQAMEHGICFAPGNVFSASGRYNNCLRLSCGNDWDARIENGLKILGDLACGLVADQ